MAVLIRLLVVVIVVAFVVRLIRGPRRRLSEFKCATCRHCGRLDADGVICRYGKKQVFKGPVHIENCIDHERHPSL